MADDVDSLMMLDLRDDIDFLLIELLRIEIVFVIDLRFWEVLSDERSSSRRLKWWS